MDFEEAVFQGWAEADFHPEVERGELEWLVRNASPRRGMGQAELHFQLPLDNDPFAPQLQGYIDLLLDDGCIVDWKTGHRIFRVLDNMQLPLYAWAQMKLKKVASVKGMLFFLRHRITSSYVFNEEDAERARQWALGLAREIEERRMGVAMEPDSAVSPPVYN